MIALLAWLLQLAKSLLLGKRTAAEPLWYSETGVRRRG